MTKKNNFLWFIVFFAMAIVVYQYKHKREISKKLISTMSSKQLRCEDEKKRHSCNERAFTSWNCEAKLCLGSWENQAIERNYKRCANDQKCLTEYLQEIFYPKYNLIMDDEKKCAQIEGAQKNIESCKEIGRFWNCDLSICLSAFEIVTWNYALKDRIKEGSLDMKFIPSFEKTVNGYCTYFYGDSRCLPEGGESHFKKCAKDGLTWVKSYDRCTSNLELDKLGPRYAKCATDKETMTVCLLKLKEEVDVYLKTLKENK